MTTTTRCSTTGLGERLNRSGFDLVLSDKRTYDGFKLVQGHFDFVTANGIEILDVQTLRKGPQRPPADRRHREGPALNDRVVDRCARVAEWQTR